jgi:ADP-ribose pyrophosphatase YjhB (NUDIX family)
MDLNILEPYLWEPDKYLKNVAIDNVIFGYHDKELKVLLQKPIVFEKWTVTGGYILKTESIEDAADRITFSRTGLKNLFFQQFRSFGNPERAVDSGFNARRINELTNGQMPDNFWIFDYFVSIGFYTLTEFSAVELKKAEFETDCAWWTVNDLPPLMFDHNLLIAEALKALRLHIGHYPIGYELLPRKFTIPEIHSLYETILGRQLDVRNFLRRLLATKIIEKLNETKSIGGHRSPFLYKFDKEKYDEGLENGVLLSF